MKKYIFCMGLAALSLTSCNDFLDVQPEGNLTSTTYFKNDQQAIDAVDHLYHQIVDTDAGGHDGLFGRDLFYEQAGGNDLVWARARSFNTLATRQYSGDESPLRNVWNDFYAEMAYANWIVKCLTDKGDDRTAVETRSLGEALFMRAFAHFYIAYRYGTDELGVPFVRWEDFKGEYDNSIPPQRETVMENYRLIVEDLENAMKYLPKFEEYGAEDQGRAHKAAALGYIAKTYAYWATWDESKWDNVIEAVNRLESEFGRGFADTYDEIFSSEFKDFWNREYIWSIPSTGGSGGGGCELPGVMLYRTYTSTYNGWGYFKPTENMYQEFAKDGVFDLDWSRFNWTYEGGCGDPTHNARMRRSILSFGDPWFFFGWYNMFEDNNEPNGFMIYKYADCVKFPVDYAKENGYVNTNGNYPTFRINFPLLRFSDLALLRAEANLMKGNAGAAKSDINALRRRAMVAELTGNPTMADLFHERRVELAFEYSDALFDLKRWDRSSNSELKALADAALNATPKIRAYHDPFSNQGSRGWDYDVVDNYEYAARPAYEAKMMTFPYPSQVIINANGAYRQLPCWE